MAPPKPLTPQSNTLFNYFSRTTTPVAPVTPPRFIPTYEGETPRRPQPIVYSDDEEEQEEKETPRRPQPIVYSDEEEEEEKEQQSESSGSPSSSQSQNRDSFSSNGKRKRGSSPQAGPSSKNTPGAAATPKITRPLEAGERREPGVKRKLSATPNTEENGSREKEVKKTKTGTAGTPKIAAKTSAGQEESSHGQSTSWPHLKFDFLQPGKLCDLHGNRPDDPHYDPKTLLVPTSFWHKQTPGMKQWWDFKRHHYDCVLFFKVGRFYELYHMDAVIAAEVCQLVYMRGEHAHVGFPEKSYSKYANIMIEKGYKVARVEQTETPEMLKERSKAASGGQKDKVVNRSIVQYSTRGVRIPTFQDDPRGSPFTYEARYLYGIFEKVEVWGRPQFGVCFIDTTMGEFHIGQFEDDRHYSRLRTLLSHYPPVQVLIAKGNLGQQTDQLINSYADVRKDELKPILFSDPSILLRSLTEENYFYDKALGGIKWPSVLQSITKSGCASPEDGWELGLRAFGGVVSYLRDCLLHHDMLSLKRFTLYRPVDSLTIPGANNKRLPSNMVLDGITLQNLDVTEGKNNVLSLVDSCWTPFGKRLIREWLCMPLAVPRDIEDRLDAIDEILSMESFSGDLQPFLKSLPDLDRLLNKVHILGSLNRKLKHPEGKAIMFDEPIYSKNKITDLMSILKGFKTCTEVLALLKENDPKCRFLSTLVNRFPNLTDPLAYFDTAFDHKAAIKDGKIIPKPGADEDYDANISEATNIEKEANTYLNQQSILLRTRVSYFGSDKKAFQLEVPDGTRIPEDYELSSSRKGYKRYVNPFTKKLLAKTISNATRRDEILRDATRSIFEKFDNSHELWKAAVDCVAKLDAIVSLTTYSVSQIEMCRPKIVYSDTPFIKIKEGRHPCMPIDVYISNSCNMGRSRYSDPSLGSFILLTGPNMGGKSTLMRQVALLAILSHVGCYVPAEACEMSVVDRIFTRLGAADNIGEGESTFFVELSETSSALKHCTQDSLVLMDELGRGTATYDGTAIAYAVSKKLAQDGVRTLFSTHYHTLVESIQSLPSVQLGHMACMVENENEEDPTQETITFLYKLVPGPCPKSYGFNAARLAGLPDEVIRCAHQKAKEFETNNNAVDAFRKLFDGCKTNTPLTLEAAMQLLKV